MQFDEVLKGSQFVYGRCAPIGVSKFSFCITPT